MIEVKKNTAESLIININLENLCKCFLSSPYIYELNLYEIFLEASPPFLIERSSKV